jgi:predicted DsbA family dithiol-disulfide isomerase
MKGKAMPKPIQIDFVSDVVCPWCVIGLRELETALARLGDVVEPDLHLQPFELNPTMPREGQNISEHLEQKFGRKMDDSSGIRQALQARAADVGFAMAMNDNSRVYNSFDAHRLLHWAGLQDAGRQVALKHALFGAYFTENLNIADADVLVEKAESVGLDGAEAREVLTSGRYADQVRAAEQGWMRSGINSVPAVVINRKYLISGGQTAAVFEDSLRRIAAEGA